MIKKIAVICICAALAGCAKTPDTPINETPDPQPEKEKDPEPDPVAVKDTTVRIDETFALALSGSSSAAALTGEGRIAIVQVSDGVEADHINLSDLSTVTIREDGQMIPKEQVTTATAYNTLMDAIGPDKGSERRVVSATLIRVVKDTLYVKPHSHKLKYDTQYRLEVEGKVLSDATVKGPRYFHTCKKPTSAEITVAKRGKADFRTVQGAIDFASSLPQTSTRTITVAEGEYIEQLFIKANNKLTIKAAEGAKPVISYANCEKWNNGTGSSVSSTPIYGKAMGKNGGREVILIESCNELTFDGLIMKNTFGSTAGQAEVIYNNDNSGGCAVIIKNCELHSLQDTFLTKGYVWVYNTLIAGHCDFIWGYPKACLFEDCEIRCMAKGYIVQCRCQSAADKGFLFLNCRITSGQGVADGSMTLARSAGSTTAFDNVAYVNCQMSGVITTAGWHTNPTPNPSAATATTGWRECGTTDLSGAARSLSGRASCAHTLTTAEAVQYSSRAKFFAGTVMESLCK